MELHAFDNNYLNRLKASDAAVERHFAGYFRQLLVIKLRARRLAPDVIDDICQETFVRVLATVRRENGDGLRRAECLGAFVNSVCNFVLQEEHRYAVRNASLDPVNVAALPDRSIDIDGLLTTQETGEAVRQVLAQLPEKDQALLRAVFLEEKDKDDVCREYGVDRDYLRVLLHRAKARFRCRYRGQRVVTRLHGMTPAAPRRRMRGSELN